MGYCAASDVAAYCPNLLTGASNFSTTSVPTLTQVNNWITSGCGAIDLRLKAKNYTPPSASGGTVWDELTQLNALYAAARAELSRTNVRISLDERTRSSILEKMFQDGVDKLLTLDLALAGLDSGSGGYMGGVSDTDKDAVADNSDRVESRFKRGQFKYS